MKTTISPRQRIAASLLAGGATARQVAETLGINPCTVSVWRSVGAFREAIAQEQNNILAEARSRLLNAATTAIDALTQVTLQGSEEQRVNAAKAILNQCKLTPSVNDFGMENAIDNPPDLTDEMENAIQTIETYQQDSAYLDHDFILFLQSQELLDDQEALTLMVEDRYFLKTMLDDYKEWLSEQNNRP